jgi:pantoate--beta-alanine ligase
MQVTHEVQTLRRQLDEWRKQGLSIGFVPTMGNLHAGHLSLVETALQHADRIVSSVFVNPLQFGPNEDFDRYPRTLEADRSALAGAGCHLLFAPAPEVIYPRGRSLTVTVHVPDVSEGLCGPFRPGHFDGMATVVNLLFNIVQPQVAVFGEKDYQQLQVIRRMVADLHMPVRIVGQATAREADGLAMSSRNQYLSAQERDRAPALYRVLCATRDRLAAGERDFAALEAAAMAQLRDAGFEPQYVAIRAPDLSAAVPENGAFVVAAAAFLGRTRLIDNILYGT